MAGDTEFLIIGGDSWIGAAVRSQLLADGREVLATSRRPGSPDIHLDLSAVVDDVQPLPHAAVALIAAGITDQVRCAEADARSTNVENTLLLARHLMGLGTRVVFLSTNLVLDGSVPKQQATAPYRPLSEYGRQKADVETALLMEPGKAAICRLSKVLHRDLPLIRGWLVQLKAKEPVRAFSDLMIAPISLAYAATFVSDVMQRDLSGIFQVSGDKEVSYCDLARALARRIGRSADLVECVASAEAKVRLAASPRHPGLDASRVQDEFGIRPQSLDEVIDELAPAI